MREEKPRERHGRYLLKSRLVIKPRFVITITGVLAVILLASALIEFYLSRRDITSILSEEASSLTQSIAVSSDNATLAVSEVEDIITEKFLVSARLIERLSRMTALTGEELSEIARSNDLARITVVDKKGDILLTASSKTDGDSEPVAFRTASFRQYLEPLLVGEQQEMVIGFGQSSDMDGEHYAVAVRRTGGGAVVVTGDAAEMIRLRREIGIGRLIDDITKGQGLVYVVLQDTAGIIAASRNIESVSRIAGDTFLVRILEEGTADSLVSRTRLTGFADKTVFEAASPFFIEDQLVGILRVGLSSDHINEVNDRVKRRLVVISVVLLIIGVVVFSFLVVNQNYRILDDVYERTKTHSGNVLEHMADGVIAIDRNGKVTTFNRAAESIFGLSEKEAVGMDCSTVVLFGEEIRESLESGIGIEDTERECVLRGKRTVLSFNSSVVTDRDGNVDSVVVVVKDLTEHRLMEEDLRRKEKLTAMGELASGVAHEVRNPLNAISMIAQRLEQEFDPTKDADEYRNLTSTVVKESERLNDIIGKFLKFARPPELELSRIELGALIEEVIDLIRPEAGQRGITVTADTQPIGTILLDGNQMKQVLLNLLQNGLQATSSRGSITVASEPYHGGVIITVSDTGKGIPPENIDRVFDLYFTTKEHGTGMGLSLANQIVNAHGGRIEVESEVNRGTTFRILLPGRRQG